MKNSFKSISHAIYIAVSLIAIVIGSYIWLSTSAPLEQSEAAPLYTKENKIINSQTNQPVVLRGVVSDYFRYGMNYNYPTLHGGLKSEIEKVEQLKQMGADISVIGLYLARLDEIKQNIGELDDFINYARSKNIYIFLAPAGNAFLETMTYKLIGDNKKFFEGIGPNDLARLTEFLASRYGNYPDVIYQLTAEPNIPYSAWEIKQKELAAIVRRHSNNLIMVTTPYYTPYSYPSIPVLPYDNIIYSVGGYVSRNDHSPVGRQLKNILGGESLTQNYPVMVTEFGGNYGSDFSSTRDLALFKDILEEINRANLSYTAYRLSSAFQNDGLALFDIEGKLSPKGRVFIDSF